jgi:tRNA (uracil-5-)-methyltransferase
MRSIRVLGRRSQSRLVHFHFHLHVHIYSISFRNIYTYKKGVTLLLRDSLDMTVPLTQAPSPEVGCSRPSFGPNIPPPDNDTDELSKAFHTHVCVTDQKATVREIVRVPGCSITTTTLSSSSSPSSSSSLLASASTSLPEKLVEELKKDREWVFEYNANSFFQNNNSVLGGLVGYVRDAIFAPIPAHTHNAATATAASSNSKSDPDPTHADSMAIDTPTSTFLAPPPSNPTHLIDAYCGAGLFSITLSPYFESTTGIELSVESIESAERNARINGLILDEKEDGEKGKKRVEFKAGDASAIFDSLRTRRKPGTTNTSSELESADAADADSNLFLDTETKTESRKWLFPPSQTVLLIDPPRKGCDDVFLRQLIEFGAGRVVYVSCNVHTQARDVGWILRQSVIDVVGGGERKKKYVLESLRGFDLFPQTAHVESVAVLRLVDY